MTDTRTSVFPEANRIYKSRLFEMIYSEKEELLELYNAIHGTHYDNPEQLQINTLKKKCKTLDDYAIYTNLVRQYAKDMPLREAVELAISECIENDILAKFLTKNKAEAIKVSIYEYDEEKHMRQEREYSWNKGHEEGLEQGLLRGTDRMNTLILKLSEIGRTDDIIKAASNPEYQKKLFEEFGL